MISIAIKRLLDSITTSIARWRADRVLIERVMHPVALSIAESLRFSPYHQEQKNLLDHMLISRRMMTSFVSAEIHNDMVHDVSIAFATDNKFPESDNAPMVAEFDAVENAMMHPA